MIALLLVACTHRPLPPDRLAQTLGALELARTVAASQHPEDPAACVGWATVEAVAPVAAGAIVRAHQLAPVELPTLELTAADCLGDPPPDVARVVELVDVGLAGAASLLPLLAIEDCRVAVTAGAALSWARAIDLDGWTVRTSAVVVDLTACP